VGEVDLLDLTCGPVLIRAQKSCGIDQPAAFTLLRKPPGIHGRVPEGGRNIEETNYENDKNYLVDGIMWAPGPSLDKFNQYQAIHHRDLYRSNGLCNVLSPFKMGGGMVELQATCQGY
jgi:hypothetical protein